MFLLLHKKIGGKFDLPEMQNTAIIRFAQSGRGAARLARLHGVQEVGGSNPLAPTAVRRTVLPEDGFIFNHSLYCMETNEATSASPISKHSIISLVLGIFTVITFCGGIMIPIPFTSVICAPVSFLLGILALIYGAISLNRIRKHNESGSPMAWMGILSGGFIFLCILCMLVALISLFMAAPESFPPFLQNYQI